MGPVGASSCGEKERLHEMVLYPHSPPLSCVTTLFCHKQHCEFALAVKYVTVCLTAPLAAWPPCIGTVTDRFFGLGGTPKIVQRIEQAGKIIFKKLKKEKNHLAEKNRSSSQKFLSWKQ